MLEKYELTTPRLRGFLRRREQNALAARPTISVASSIRSDSLAIDSGINPPMFLGCPSEGFSSFSSRRNLFR